MATERMASNLSASMLNQSDPEIVRDGTPAYLLLIDSLVAEDPHNTNLLLTAARLYSAYAGAMVADEERRRRLTDQAMDYARRAFCPLHPQVCSASSGPFDVYEASVAGMSFGDLQTSYVYSTVWAGWIEARAGDWEAIADLPKVNLLLQRIAGVEPAYEKGRVQLYLAILYTLVPPVAGGNPEQAKQHFQAAMEYSAGEDLMIKVEYARRYARMVFDQRLHDLLLNEVLQADPVQSGLTLSNVLAQQQAKRLLNDDYF